MRMCGLKEKQENDEQGKDLLSDMKWVFWGCFFLNNWVGNVWGLFQERENDQKRLERV